MEGDGTLRGGIAVKKYGFREDKRNVIGNRETTLFLTAVSMNGRREKHLGKWRRIRDCESGMV